MTTTCGDSADSSSLPLKPCAKPDCSRLVSPISAYCCSPCRLADQPPRYEIHQHSPGCDERAARRHRSDSVPAILNDGCGHTLPRRDGQAGTARPTGGGPVMPAFPGPECAPSRRVQHVEITALADLPDRVCLCGARWRGDQEHP